MNHNLKLNKRLMEQEKIEAAVHDFTALLQKAAWNATLPYYQQATEIICLFVSKN
jgi:hypothetical protein